VLVPYRHEENPPDIEPVRPDVVRVRYGDTEDLVLIAGERGLIEAGDVRFAGQVGIVRRTSDAVVLHIVEGVSLRVPEMIAQFPGPVTLELRPGLITGVCDGAARSCFLHWTAPPPTPARLTIDGKSTPVYSTFDGYLRFSVEAGPHRFRVQYPSRPGLAGPVETEDLR
jgi:hypothetical protein